jgi:hypothetical protein
MRRHDTRWARHNGVCYGPWSKELGQPGRPTASHRIQENRRCIIVTIDSVHTPANFISRGVLLTAIAQRSLVLPVAQLAAASHSSRASYILAPALTTTARFPRFPATAPATAQLCALAACQYVLIQRDSCAPSFAVPNTVASIPRATSTVARFTSQLPRVARFSIAPTRILKDRVCTPRQPLTTTQSLESRSLASRNLVADSRLLRHHAPAGHPPIDIILHRILPAAAVDALDAHHTQHSHRYISRYQLWRLGLLPEWQVLRPHDRVRHW